MIHGNLIMAIRAGECIVIGENIIIQCVQATGGRLRLSIRAPKDIPVRRIKRPEDTTNG